MVIPEPIQASSSRVEGRTVRPVYPTPVRTQGLNDLQQHFQAKGIADVSVCIASWNCRNLLRNCLNSLLRQPQGVSLQVIVVDNASADGAADMVEEEFPEVSLLRNPENLGFARANNQAAARAHGDCLFFLNNDTVIPPGTLRRLVEYCSQHPEIGILGPGLRDGMGRLQVSYRRRPSVQALLHRTSLLRWTGLFKSRYGHYRRGEFDPCKTRQVDVLMGAAMFMPRSAFLECGGWDEEFTFGGEDLDLSLRVGRRRPLVFYPDVEIVHFGRVSTRQHIGFASSQMAIGLLRYLRKAGHTSPALFLYKSAITLDAPLQVIMKAFQYLWRRVRGDADKAAKSLLALRGSLHFLFRGLIPFWQA
jgi:N-acetylglucosaminyl-diphospho-decaprenol L-rhamnosyltransferase